MKRARSCLMGVLLFTLSVVFTAGPVSAGMFDGLGDTLKKAGEDIADTVKEVGREAGIIDEEKAEEPPADSAPASAEPATAEKLPGGVTSRLNKMHAEMDKAEKALEKGAGTGVDRARRAEQSLKRVRRFRDEIEKSYSGQYSEAHPDVAAAFGRLAELEKGVEASAQEATAAEDSRRQVREADEAAAANAAADDKSAARARREGAAASRQAAEADCEGWNTRLEVYTEGEKALYACVGAGDADMPRCRGIYDEAVALMGELTQTPLAADPCSSLRTSMGDLNRYMDNFKPVLDRYTEKQAVAEANMGEIVFSKKPITPKKPSGLTRKFDAGDYIYGLIRTTKPWSAILKSESSGDVRVDVRLDDKKIHAQFVKLKKPELLQRRYLVFDIAPKPKNMTAYGDPGLEYGKSTATMRQGPNELTHHLGQLGPGTHTMEFSVAHRGDVYAAGSFTVEGKNFKSYAKLHAKIAEGVAKAVTLPAAKMTNKKMAAEMTALLKNAGWNKIRRLNIVDKDWWIDRVSGGNSPVKSRHMAAAALAKDKDGYYYKVCTFQQDKLITGGFGKLYLSHQGDRVPIPKANIDK